MLLCELFETKKKPKVVKKKLKVKHTRNRKHVHPVKPVKKVKKKPETVA